MIWTILQTVSAVLMTLITIAAVIYAIKQVDEAKRVRVLSAYLTFEARLINEQARADRRYIYEHCFDNPSAITQEDREVLERVCTTFDILGVLVREGLMYRPLVFKPFYDVIIKCWKRSYDFIEFERKPNRKAQTYMQDFEYLYRQAEEYREANKFPEVEIHRPQPDKPLNNFRHRGQLSQKAT